MKQIITRETGMHLLIQDDRRRLYHHQYQIYISSHLQMQKEACFDGQGQNEPIESRSY